MVLVVKNLSVTAGALRGTCSIPSWGRSPGAGLGNSLQYSCLENPMHRGGWWATVHRVTKSRAWVKQLSMNIRTIITSNHFSVLFSVLCLIFQFKHVSLVFELIPSTWTLEFELQFLNFLFFPFFLSSSSSSFFFFFVSLGLCPYTWAFSSCSKHVLLLIATCRLLIAVA